MKWTFSMALPGIMDRPTMVKTVYSMDSQMPPLQMQMIINQQQDMFSWHQKELWHGNQRDKQLLQCLWQNLNVMLSEAGREAFWLRNLYDKLGFPQIGPTVIKSNNEGLVILSHNPQFHAWTKHIEIHHHWVRDLVNDKILDVWSCWDPEQTADILTKPLLKPKHQRHRCEMGMGTTK